MKDKNTMPYSLCTSMTPRILLGNKVRYSRYLSLEFTHVQRAEPRCHDIYIA
jgi:hypothetical protein